MVAQWVRMKCMFGCSNHGRKGACPPQTLAVSDCERFLESIVMLLSFTSDYKKIIPKSV
ncbi:MAG: hypothetical protein GTN71_01640 [Anaerolineae bacterium]|nr:hypothetical protein [Anaerolineae bacterium]